RRRTGDKDLVFRSGTVWRGEFQGFGIYERGLHAFRRIEVFHIAVAGEGGRFRHEVSPDGRVGGSAGQTEVAVVVKSDPDPANEVRGEPREPTIARSSGLACCGQSKTAGSNGRARTAVEHVLENAGDKVGHTRVEYLMRLRADLFERRSICA